MRFPSHPARSNRWLPWLLMAGLLSAAGAARAYDLQTSPYLLGDWGGLRRELDEQGIRCTGDYSGETAYNAHGGQHRSARYSQNLKLGVQF
ncbi:porin, partial [Burkholderia sp. SIMBA_013]